MLLIQSRNIDVNAWNLTKICRVLHIYSLDGLLLAVRILLRLNRFFGLSEMPAFPLIRVTYFHINVLQVLLRVSQLISFNTIYSFGHYKSYRHTSHHGFRVSFFQRTCPVQRILFAFICFTMGTPLHYFLKNVQPPFTKATQP